MPITFSPDAGQILMCDFDSPAFMRPEMEKVRQCIVISPRYRRHTGCCIVVPVSTVQPEHIAPYHFQIPTGIYDCFDHGREMWVKGDMLTHAGFSRLDRPFVKGIRSRVVLSSDHLMIVRHAAMAAIGLLPKPAKSEELTVQPK